MLNSFVKMGVVELSLSSFVFKTCVSVAHILQLQIIVEKNVGSGSPYSKHGHETNTNLSQNGVPNSASNFTASISSLAFDK